MQLYEYAVICDEKRDKEGDLLESAEIVVEPTTILAKDEDQVQMVAARAIPDEYKNGKMERLLVVVRPF